MARLRFTAVEAFLVSGLAVILAFWVADLLAGAPEPHDHGGGEGDLVTRLYVVFFSLGFSAVGLVYEHFSRLGHDGVFALRHAAGYLLILDGSLHLFALNDHRDHAFFVAFFAVVAAVQIAAGIAVPRMGPRLDAVWLGLSLFLLLAYAATRSFPVWPLTEVETVDPLGALSKATEVLLVLVLVDIHRRGRITAPAEALAADARS